MDPLVENSNVKVIETELSAEGKLIGKKIRYDCLPDYHLDDVTNNLFECIGISWIPPTTPFCLKS